MHSIGKEEAQGERQSQSVFDPEEAATMLGLTSQQKRLADNLLKGMTQAQAAIEAGYSAKHASSAGNKAANSSAVQAYLSWARAGGYGVPDDTASDKELKRLLTRQARGSGPNATRAAELLMRFNRQDRDEQAAKPLDPIQMLASMAKLMHPLGELVARVLAEAYEIDWRQVETKIGNKPRTSPAPPLTAADVLRAQHVARMNSTNSILDRADNGLPQSSIPAPSPGSASGGAANPNGAAPPPHDHRPEPPSFGLGPVKVFGD